MAAAATDELFRLVPPENVLENVTEGVVVASADGRFVVFNAAARRMVGRGPADVGPAGWQEHYHLYREDGKTPFPAGEVPLVRALQGHATDEVPMRVRTGTGAETHLLVSGRPLATPDGRLAGGIVTIRDVTPRRRAESLAAHLSTELERRVEELTALNGELEAFSYSVSHDLRAPLRHIVGFVNMLRKRVEERLDDTARRYLEHIAGAARDMGRLIDDLLAFSRMQRAGMVDGEVDLAELVAAARAELAADCGEREIDWVVAPLPRVRGDGAMLRMAFQNLLSNAVKYTRPRERARIEVGSRTAPSGDLEVWVRDNGVGFDMRFSGKLFGVFQRLHGPDEFEGTGIGLATVRRIVHRHGGHTWAEGEPGAGATFWLSLPQRARVEG